jgi:hypothetical protein
MTQTQLREFTSYLGKRSYKARVARLGIERIREIARENGKKGGRPKGSVAKHKKSTRGGQ